MKLRHPKRLLGAILIEAGSGVRRVAPSGSLAVASAPLLIQDCGMATKFPSWRRWALLALAAVAAWQAARFCTTQRSSTEKLINQLWVERMPSNPRDMVWHFVAIDREGRHAGALGQASRWRVQSDAFLWRQQGDQFTFVTPQNRCRSTLKARTWKCQGQAPKPFDLCLELAGNGKQFRYYSRTDWTINRGGQLEGDDQPGFGRPALQAALAGEGEETGDAAGGECAAGPQ
jgi:hypothetical protein